MLEYDDILEHMGEFGHWQRWLFALMWVPSAASAMAVFMYEFIAFTPDHRCMVDPCEDASANFNQDYLEFAIPKDENIFSKCSVYLTKNNDSACVASSFIHDPKQSVACPNGWIFDKSTFNSTAVMDFEMLCSNDWQKSLAQSIYMIGMLIGSFFFGFLSDLTGRRTTLIVSSIVLALSGSLSALLPANPSLFFLFAGCRFLSGMGHVGTFMMSFALALEYTGPGKRVFCGCLIETPFALGGLIVGFLSWAGIRNWRTLQLICSAPWILIISYLWLVPESPRWLISQGKIDRLKADVRKLAKRNEKRYDESLFVEKTCSTSSFSQVEKVSTLDLFRPLPICVRTLNMFYNWAVTTLCYYGLTMTASSLSDNFFLNYTLLILVEIPAHFFCMLVMDRWGRKPILSFCQIFSGLSCILAGFVSHISWLQVGLSLLGKFGATASFTIVFVYTAEMYPTGIRSTAVGSSSTCGRIGGFLAPQVAYMASIWKPLPLLIMGGSALLGGIIALINLPETVGQKLPESMSEALNLGKKNKNVAI